MPRAAKRKGLPDLVGEQHLRLLVEAARDYAIFTLDGEGRVLTWNSGAQRFNGYEEREILGEHFSCFYAVEDRKAGKPAHELEIARRDGRFEGEGWRLKRGGTGFWACIVITALRDPGGRLVGFGHVTRDITERLQATERFRLALEGAPTGMIMVDALGHIVLVNAQVEKLFEYPREDLVGKSIEMLVPLRYRHGHSGLRGAFLAGPEARPMGAGRELFGLRKDGTEVPIEIGLNPLKSAEGEFVLASIVDITERKRSVEQFRLALEAAPTGMIMIDESGKLVLVNAHIEKLFGFERQELIGRPIEMLVPERFRARHPGFRGAFFADPKARPMGGGRDLFGLRKDGSEIPIEIGLNPLQTAEGTFVLGSVADITGRKHAEREKELLLDKLRASNAQLTTSLKEREVLLQEVHHRVKNNLQVISSLISMQLRRLKGGSSREALEECQTRVQAIALIHAQLYQTDDKARVPLTAYVRSLAANVFEATSVSRSTVSLVLDIDDVVLAVDRAIPCGLILNELITNALKHAFPDGRHGTVRIDIKQIGDGNMRLRVADDGIGIAPETEIGKTDSLGLHLVTTLAEQLNADLDVDGREGTVFQLTFAAEEP